jgi:predicted lipoprotein with Yx(FWY)xxD motif
MSKAKTWFQRGRFGARDVRLGAVALAASAIILAPMVSASGATSPTLKSANVPGFSGALVNHSSKTLYVLSSEKGAKIKCSGACLSTWPPLLVKSSVTKVALGANVNGKIGFVTRSKTMKQVTFNSYPLYTFAGDSASLQSHGEGIVALGGTWYLVKASSSSVGLTVFKKSSTGTTATTSNTTTTTSGSGGYNY